MRALRRESQHLAWESKMGSARVQRAGFGLAPKQSFSTLHSSREREHGKKVRDREDATTSMRDACATLVTGRTAKLSAPPA